MNFNYENIITAVGSFITAIGALKIHEVWKHKNTSEKEVALKKLDLHAEDVNLIVEENDNLKKKVSDLKGEINTMKIAQERVLASFKIIKLLFREASSKYEDDTMSNLLDKLDQMDEQNE